MLPAMASMMAGGMQQQFSGGLGAAGLGANGNVFGKVIEEMMKQAGGRAQPQPEEAPQSSSSNPWGDILGQVLKGGQAQTQQQTPSPSGNPWGDVLDQILKGGQGQPQQRQAPQRAPAGNPLEDLLKGMFGGGAVQEEAQTRARPQAQTDNPLGRILEEMMKGGASRSQAESGEDDAPQPRRRTQQSPSNNRSDNRSDNPWGDMFETGRKTQDSYNKGLEDIFDGFLKGMDRNR